MSIINLTPHTIVLVSDVAGPPTGISIPASGAIARATEASVASDPADGLPTTTVRYIGTVDLPEPIAGTFFIVSAVTAQVAHQFGRYTGDLLVPGEQVRDGDGRVIGCRSLCRWTPPSGRASLDSILAGMREWASDHTQTEFGYAADTSAVSDEDVNRIMGIAEQLIASLCPSPGDPTQLAVTAVRDAMDVLAEARRREVVRTDAVIGRQVRQLARAKFVLAHDASPAFCSDIDRVQ